MRVFLSASIPLPERDPNFLETADIIAIRESVKALTLVVLERKGHLVFGGHPAITPVVRLLFRGARLSTRDHVTLYQSALFRKEFPPENDEFERVIIVDAVGDDRQLSLARMRERMLTDSPLTCGVFIGGMEGVIEEFNLFRSLHPNCPAFPIASTGAAAAVLFRYQGSLLKELQTELTYPTLFRKLLPRD